jgi:hypothetical protein
MRTRGEYFQSRIISQAAGQAHLPDLRDSYQFGSSSLESLSLRNLAVKSNKIKVGLARCWAARESQN